MIKRFKPLFCFILAVILPLCFVACKSSKDNNSSGDDGDNTGENNNPNNTPAQTYVLDNSEINRLLISSFDDCEDFIIGLNNSNLLKNNDYSSAVGDKTYSTFDYAFYPALYAKNVSSPFEKNKVYAYQPQTSTTKKYFEINTSDTNDKIFVNILIDAVDELTIFFYEFNVSEGDLNSLKLSYLFADTSLIRFSESLFDFKNSICEIGIGNLNEFTSNRTFLENNFTKDKFAEISNNHWSYSYYQRFDFSSNKTYILDSELMPENEHLIAQFDSFGFIDAFDKLDEYKAIPNSSLTNLGQDLFLQFSTQGLISFNSSESVFEISEED